MSIPIGSMVRDRVTGLEGVAENRATFIYGCDQYCVQPIVKDSAEKVPESYMFDEPQLEVLDQIAMKAPAEPEQLIKLGQKVRCTITGIRGTATGRCVYLNGCARILIEERSRFFKKRESFWGDEQQFEIMTGLFTSAKPMKLLVDIQEKKPKAGGPARMSSKR